MDETSISGTADSSPTALRLARGLEEASSLDGTVAMVDDLLERTLGRSAWLTAMLRGHSIGHPLHPLLTDLPLGLWLGTGVLDVFGGRASHDAADTLLCLGNVAALPTIAAGLADWRTGDQPIRRVGLVHAGLNATGLALYAASWRLRRRGHRGAGVALSMAGGMTMIVSGYLGGHLSFQLRSPRDDRI